MSKIVIVASEPAPQAELLAELHAVLGDVPLHMLKDMLKGARPLVERRLFGNAHPECAATLKTVASILRKHDIVAQVFELEPEESYDSAPLEECRIDFDIMTNILDDA